MTLMIEPLPAGKKIFFASDFHLGTPNVEQSLIREKKIVRWLEEMRPTAQAFFLLGDVFDFWFEYRHVVPKGFVRLLGKLSEITDSGIPVYFFPGNHDMWTFGYLEQEIGLHVYRDPQAFEISGKKFLIGHGDGLGPGDRQYKLLKKVFKNRTARWFFTRIHPNASVALAKYWSKSSRINKTEEKFLGDKEWLYIHCKETELNRHHDFYVFGHRHLPLDLPVEPSSRYINLGEWVHHCTYAVFDGAELRLERFD